MRLPRELIVSILAFGIAASLPGVRANTEIVNFDAAFGLDTPGEQQQHKDDDEVPRRKQGSGGDDHERRIQESLYRKAEHNRPTKEFVGSSKTVGAGGRISQPAGKSLAM